MLVLALFLQAPADVADVARHSPDTAAVVDIFVSACLDGSIRLPASEIREIRPGDVPFRVLDNDRPGATTHYYKVKKPKDPYLVTVSYARPTSDGVISECSVSADDIDLKTAGILLHHALTGSRPGYRDNAEMYSLFLPEQNAHISATDYWIDLTRFDRATSQKLYEKLNRQKHRLRRKPEPVGN